MIYSFQYTVYSDSANCYVFDSKSIDWGTRFRYYKWIKFKNKEIFSYWCQETGQGWIAFE